MGLSASAVVGTRVYLTCTPAYNPLTFPQAPGPPCARETRPDVYGRPMTCSAAHARGCVGHSGKNWNGVHGRLPMPPGASAGPLNATAAERSCSDVWKCRGRVFNAPLKPPEPPEPESRIPSPELLVASYARPSQTHVILPGHAVPCRRRFTPSPSPAPPRHQPCPPRPGRPGSRH